MTCHSDMFGAIRSRVTMAQVVEHYGGKVGRDHKALCPFHKDRHPSLHVYDHSFYCFVCGAGGDVVRYVALLLGVKDWEAAKHMDQQMGLHLDLGKADGRQLRSWQREKAHRERQREEERMAQQRWAQEFREIQGFLSRHPRAKDQEEGWALAELQQRADYLEHLMDEEGEHG